MTIERFDVIIVGAGLSGIGAARYLKTRLPGKSFVILETKPRMGGTWDLFRYPGIRSDSDMHTMGYAFKPWKHPKAISEAGAIIQYIEETAAENDLDRHIRYRHRIIGASWSSAQSQWTLEVEQADGRHVQFQSSFIFSCSGYYNHHEGYLPEWPGYHDYKGTLVHPQFWPEDLDYAGKRIVIVGSGCDRGYAGAGAGREGRRGRAIAALADLCGEPAVRGRLQHLPEDFPPRKTRVPGDTLAHHHHRTAAREAVCEGPQTRQADAD